MLSVSAYKIRLLCRYSLERWKKRRGVKIMDLIFDSIRRVVSTPERDKTKMIKLLKMHVYKYKKDKIKKMKMLML